MAAGERPKGKGPTLDAAIRAAARDAPGKAGEKKTYRVAEISVDVNFKSPGEVGVYSVELEQA